MPNQTIHARIFGETEDFLLLDCLIQVNESKHYETRHFDKILFDNLPRNTEYVIIEIVTKPSQMIVTIKDGTNIVNPADFVDESLFDEIKEHPIFQLPEKETIEDLT